MRRYYARFARVLTTACPPLAGAPKVLWTSKHIVGIVDCLCAQQKYCAGSRMARILLVEDDRDLRPLLEHVLLSAGYEVTAVETVKSAVSLIEAQPFDLVFTDVSLPD